jgi:hypothetical protein
MRIPHRNDSADTIAGRPHQRLTPAGKVSGGDETVLPVVAARVLDRDGPTRKHRSSISEVEPPSQQGLSALCRVEADIQRFAASRKLIVSKSMIMLAES